MDSPDLSGSEFVPARVVAVGREGAAGPERVTLDAGQSKTVSFTIDRSDFGFYDNQGHFVVEPGEIDVYAGDSSQATMKATFTVTGRR